MVNVPWCHECGRPECNVPAGQCEHWMKAHLKPGQAVSAPQMKTHDDLVHIVAKIAFPPWQIGVRLDGTRSYLQVFDHAGRCNVTGEPLAWAGRKWMLGPHMTETEVVKTALKAVLSAVEHEALEKFTYLGATVFDPHLSVAALLAARANYPLDARR